MAETLGSSASDPKGVPESDVSRVVPQGNFPFPRLGDGLESRQLVWLRNHANYLANRGWLDYVRAISIVLRGVVVNMLIGLPFLIIAALFVALLSVRDWGFAAALVFVAATLVWIVLSPILTRLWNIFRLQNTIAMGSSSSVKIRDRFERSFGAFLVATVSVAMIEGLSFFLDDFHFWVNESDWGAPQLVSIGTVTAGLFAAAGRILPKLGGKAFNAAILIVGLVGVLVPVVIVMFLANFFAFGGSTARMSLYVAIAGFFLSAVVAIGFVLALWTDAFRLKDNLIAAGVLVLALVAFSGLIVLADNASADDAELQAKLLVLDLSQTNRNRTLDDRIGSRPPAEIDSLVDFKAYSDEFAAYLNVEELFPTEGKYSELTPEQLEDAREVDFALGELYREAHGLPGVGVLVGAVDSEGFSETTRIEPEIFEPLASELQLLALRAKDMNGLFASDGGARALIGPTLSVPLANPAEFGFTQDDWEATGDQLIIVSEDLIAQGKDEMARGERLIEDSSGREVEDVLEQGFDLVDRGFDRIQRGEQLLAVGDAMSSGAEPLYLESYFYGTEGVPMSPVGAPVNSHDFPLLAGLYPFEFSWVSFDLFGLETDFLAAREELARSAVFSGRVSDVVRNLPEVDEIRKASLGSSAVFALSLAIVVWAYGWLAVDPNRTSLHGMYRDRLAAAYLVGADTKGDVDIEEDLDLHELSRFEAGSTAPYHIINAALNLQASKDISIHDRSSDFFIFSKRFIGGERTGYCRSDTMERAFPEMSLSTAMAISAAAASPNMGRSTQPALVAFMAMLNVRLGFWMPNPGRLEAKIGMDPKPLVELQPANTPFKPPPGFCTAEVISEEANELEARWQELGSDRTYDGGLVGLAFSGGGIRSATLNLGLVQTLFEAGIFNHVDYMSTVSGGGYLGSSISSAMRSRETTRAQVTSSNVTARPRADGKQIVKTPPRTRKFVPNRFGQKVEAQTEFTFNADAVLNISNAKVTAGQRLLRMEDPNVLKLETERAREKRDDQDDQEDRDDQDDQETATPWWRPGGGNGSFGHQFGWRVRPTALLREVSGRLDEKSRSVNVSDGGHIENLAVVELLRRRCRYIIVGDGGMDVHHNFGALTILIRTARVEFGIDIDINLDPLRLGTDGFTKEHWAIGKISYPPIQIKSASEKIRYPTNESGYLLYCKSSLTGSEAEGILGYRKTVPLFPHQTTADQFFDEGQFESYRLLGQHIGDSMLSHLTADPQATTYEDLQRWFEELYNQQRSAVDEATS